MISSGPWMESTRAGQLSLDAGKSVVVGVASDKAQEGDRHVMTVGVRQAAGIDRADLAGYWHGYLFADTSEGRNGPGWRRAYLEVDAEGIILDGWWISESGITQTLSGALGVSEDGDVTLEGAIALDFDFSQLSLDSGKTFIAGLARDSSEPVRERLLVFVRSGRDFELEQRVASPLESTFPGSTLNQRQ